ncbi:hypothetical protein ACIBG4_11680 [Nonomuraea sp. NPDC050383]|uniref:hypothetical protein n=1 Tax=Nonomuraea sp. NPDC050383 TaxID=3364362 RepID=UPI0037B9B7A3
MELGPELAVGDGELANAGFLGGIRHALAGRTPLAGALLKVAQPLGLLDQLGNPVEEGAGGADHRGNRDGVSGAIETPDRLARLVNEPCSALLLGSAQVPGVVRHHDRASNSSMVSITRVRLISTR